jgi:DNA-directed RNA polymerase subunit RPC12/RpoP
MKCFNCGTELVYDDHPVTVEDMTWQNINCPNCHQTWYDE